MIFPTISLYGQKEKCVSDFKMIKKNTDSLFLMPIYVKIDAVWYQSLKTDKEITNKVYNQFYTKVKSLLNKKYILIEDSSDFEYSESVLTEMDNLRLLLVDLKNPISKIDIPNSIDSLISPYHQNSFLFIGLSGYYTEGVSPYQKAIGDFTNISLTAYAAMSVSLFIVDKERNEVLYFNEEFVKDDPRVPELLDRITLKAIKTIYYK
jgi:hypothetical protein